MTSEEQQVMKEHTKALERHSRVLECFCECIGMEAANQERLLFLTRSHEDSPFLVNQDSDFRFVMQKYGLINEDGTRKT